MALVAGMNHVAVVTDDLDRFVDFYTSVFDLEVVFSETTPAFRHAILRTGPDSWLHPAEVYGNPHGTAVADMLNRGPLDHLALTVASPQEFETLRSRLRQRGCYDGAVDDLGAWHSLWFEDADGMRVELVVILDQELRGIHEPRPMVATPAV